MKTFPTLFLIATALLICGALFAMTTSRCSDKEKPGPLIGSAILIAGCGR